MKFKEEEYLNGRFTPTCMEEIPRKRPLSKCIEHLYTNNTYIVSTLSNHKHLTVTTVNSFKECFYTDT